MVIFMITFHRMSQVTRVNPPLYRANGHNAEAYACSYTPYLASAASSHDDATLTNCSDSQLQR
jgi:hypothetical protein